MYTAFNLPLLWFFEKIVESMLNSEEKWIRRFIIWDYQQYMIGHWALDIIPYFSLTFKVYWMYKERLFLWCSTDCDLILYELDHFHWIKLPRFLTQTFLLLVLLQFERFKMIGYFFFGSVDTIAYLKSEIWFSWRVKVY